MIVVVVTIGAVWLIGMPVAHPVWALTFVVLAGSILRRTGMVAAVFRQQIRPVGAPLTSS
jgi:ABC-2 type transport system permease protein